MESEQKRMLEQEERREALRQPTGTHIVLVEHPEEGAHEAVLVNVSRTGMLLTSTRSFPEGCTMTVHPPEGAAGLLSVRMRIQRRREHVRADERWFEYGLSFVDAEDSQRHAWYLSLRLGG